MSYLLPNLNLVLVGFFSLAVTIHARSGQDSASEKDQQILEIQRQIENRNLTEANRLLAEATKHYPADPGLDNLRGVIAVQQGDYAAAEKGFGDAVKGSPEFTAAYLNLGRLYQENSALDPQAPRKWLD